MGGGGTVDASVRPRRIGLGFMIHGARGCPSPSSFSPDTWPRSPSGDCACCWQVRRAHRWACPSVQDDAAGAFPSSDAGRASAVGEDAARRAARMVRVHASASAAVLGWETPAQAGTQTSPGVRGSIANWRAASRQQTRNTRAGPSADSGGRDTPAAAGLPAFRTLETAAREALGHLTYRRQLSIGELWFMAHHSRLLVSSLLLLCACASSRPAPTPGLVHAPPTATAAPDTAWPDTIEGRWVKMGESQNRGGNYIDLQTLVRDQGEGGSVWVRLYHKDHAYDQLELEFICHSWKARPTQLFLYNCQGEVVNSVAQPNPNPWTSPTPGSVAEDLMLRVCARWGGPPPESRRPGGFFTRMNCGSRSDEHRFGYRTSGSGVVLCLFGNSASLERRDGQAISRVQR